jgi:aminoglycoside phosphotransferase (APT) family kinase protein
MSGGIGNTMTLVTLKDGAQVVLREYTWGTRAEHLGRHGADSQGRRKEVHHLRTLSDAGVPVPQVLASLPGSDNPDGEVPGLLLTLIRGRSLYAALADGQHHLLYDAGAVLRRIHSITYPAGTHGWPVEDVVSPRVPSWGHFVAAQMERSTQRVPQAGQHRAAIKELTQRLPSALEPDPPVLIHNDATPLNVMVDDHGVTGWCDWESAMVGCPTWDLARMHVFARAWFDAPTDALYEGYGRAPQPALDVSILACVLWIASLSPEKPQGFVGHYLDELGDSLAGLLERIA